MRKMDLMIDDTIRFPSARLVPTGAWACLLDPRVVFMECSCLSIYWASDLCFVNCFVWIVHFNKEFYLKKILLFIDEFSREKKGETSKVASCTYPSWGSILPSVNVPRPGIEPATEPATFWFIEWHSNKLSQVARAKSLILLYPFFAKFFSCQETPNTLTKYRVFSFSFFLKFLFSNLKYSD